MECVGKTPLYVIMSALIFYLLSGCSIANGSGLINTKAAKDSVKIYNGGNVFFVSPSGNSKNNGLSSDAPLARIQQAVNRAYPGDTIVLMPGEYYENFHSVRDGKKEKPITIIATPGAVIYGYKKPGGKIIDITHSYIHLVNLNINGNYKKGCRALKCYHDKIIYIKGSYKSLLRGIAVVGCTLQNAWGECLRIKYTNGCRVGWNRISHCGIRDFVYKRGKQNGEGIYVGTAPEQSHGKPDKTSDIYIYDNSIATYGAECIDVKENSGNIFMYDNLCTKEKAEHVGGISVRSNGNVICGNIVFNCLGAGIRLGGDTKKYGVNNSVLNNYLSGNKMAGLKIMVLPQKKMCSNVSTGEKPYYPDNKSFKKIYKSCGK